MHTEAETRRTFLKAVGTAGLTVSIAGCGGEDVPEEDESPVADDDAEETETEDDSGEEAEADTDEENHLRMTLGQPAETLDPHNYQSAPTNNVLRQVFELPIVRDADGRMTAGLATEWEQIESDRHRLTIREGVTFHNGDELVPEDVAFSIRRIVDADVDIASPQADNHPGVVDAQTVEDHAIEVISEGPNPAMLDRLTAFCEISQQSWIEDHDQAELASNPNGTGPFEVVEYDEGVSVEMEAFDRYWGESPDADRVTFMSASEDSARVNALLGGDTDFIVNVPSQDVPRLEDDDATDVIAGPSNRIVYNAMRDDVEPFTSQEFRQAMNYAVDVESIIENVLMGFGDVTSQPTLEGHFGHDPDVDPYPYDPDRAEELVAESGFEGADITLHTPVGRYVRDVEVAQTVAGYIDDLPTVSCEVEQRDFASMLEEIQEHDPDVSPHFYLLALGNLAFLGSATISLSLLSGAAFTSFHDEEVDELYTEAVQEVEESTREELLRDLNGKLHERAPWLYLHRQYSIFGVNDEKIESYQARMDERIHVHEIALH